MSKPEYYCYRASLRADDYTVSDSLPAGTILKGDMKPYLSRLTGGKGVWKDGAIRSGVFQLPGAAITRVTGSAETVPGFVLDLDGERSVIFTPVCKMDRSGRRETVGFVSTIDFYEYFRPFTSPADYEALKARVSERGAYFPLPLSEWEFVHGENPELCASMAFLDAPFNTSEGLLVLACLAPDCCLSPDPDDVDAVPEWVWTELSERFRVPLNADDAPDLPDDPRAFLSACLDAAGLHPEETPRETVSDTRDHVFAVIDENIPRGNGGYMLETTVYPSAEEAANAAWLLWNKYLTPWERETRHVRSVRIDRADLAAEAFEDYDDLGKVDWTWWNGVRPYDGAFDSDNIPEE